MENTHSNENCTHGCSGCSGNCASHAAPQKSAAHDTERSNAGQTAGGHPIADSLRAQAHPKSRIKKVIAVVSGKGGVGKSLVTSLLACALQRRGKRAAILDADITGPSIPKAFGLHGKAEGSEEGIYPVVSATGIQIMSINFLLENETDPVLWRGPIIASAVKQFWTDVIWQDVDCLFVDMPPGTGDVPLTVFQSLHVDGIVVVATPQELVGMIVEKAVKMAGLMHIPVLALAENMSYIKCPDCGKKIEVFGESRIQKLAERYAIKKTIALPLDPAFAAACDAGKAEQVTTDIFDDFINFAI